MYGTTNILSLNVALSCIIAVLFYLFGMYLSSPPESLKKVTIISITNSNKSLSCIPLPAPFLYITVHSKYPNILKYSRNGCAIDTSVLIDGPLSQETELRQIIIGNYMGESSLYVADAQTPNSSVLVYGECLSDNQNRRKYKATIVDYNTNNGASHPYGITFDKNNNVFVSFQHTDVVLHFHHNSFAAMPISDAFSDRRESFYNGTFFQFGRPGMHGSEERGLRGIAHVNNNLWIANENKDGVYVISPKGVKVSFVKIKKPVGIFFDNNTSVVFVGSKSSKAKVTK